MALCRFCRIFSTLRHFLCQRLGHHSQTRKQLTKGVGEDERLSEPPAILSPAHRPRQSVSEVRYQQMLALKAAGLSTGSIAKRLGVRQRTIQRWLALQHGPYAGARKPRRSPLDWSSHYLRE